MDYVISRPKNPAFNFKGLKGFPYSMNNKEADIVFVEVEKGLDWFIVSKKITHIYYVIEGQGYFTIENKQYNVQSGMVVEIPPNTEYSYSGNMRVILVHAPPFFEGNNEIIKGNPDVLGTEKLPDLENMGKT